MSCCPQDSRRHRSGLCGAGTAEQRGQVMQIDFETSGVLNNTSQWHVQLHGIAQHVLLGAAPPRAGTHRALQQLLDQQQAHHVVPACTAAEPLSVLTPHILGG